MESFLREYQIPIDQEKIINDFPKECHADDKDNRGLLHSSLLGWVGKKYGFAADECDAQQFCGKEYSDDDLNVALLKVFNSIQPRQTILIATRDWINSKGVLTGEQHCLRFLRLEGNHRFLALEPTKGEERLFDFQDIRLFRPWLYILKLW